MYVIGFFEMYEGRYEFEHIHERNMGVAFVLFVLSIAFGVSASMYGGVTGLFSFGLGISATFVFVAAFLGVAQAVAIALLLSTPLRSLSTPDINSKLNWGVALYIMVSVLAGIGSVLLSRSLTYYPTQGWSISVPPYFWPFLVISQSVSVLGLGLFWHSYRAVEDRFHRGELRPTPKYPTYFYPPPFQAPPPPR